MTYVLFGTNSYIKQQKNWRPLTETPKVSCFASVSANNMNSLNAPCFAAMRVKLVLHNVLHHKPEPSVWRKTLCWMKEIEFHNLTFPKVTRQEQRKNRRGPSCLCCVRDLHVYLRWAAMTSFPRDLYPPPSSPCLRVSLLPGPLSLHGRGSIDTAAHCSLCWWTVETAPWSSIKIKQITFVFLNIDKVTTDYCRDYTNEKQHVIEWAGADGLILFCLLNILMHFVTEKIKLYRFVAERIKEY